MSYYKKLLTEITVKESAVDCAKCSDLYKCCTYRPFIANFLVGEFADSFLNFNLNDWDFTICGISPSIEYRKQFKGKGQWGFGTDATLLCTFYDKASGGCQIWQSRPGVCRTFFCKSSYFEAGTQFWKNAEDLTWMVEWLLIEDFLYEEGWLKEEIEEAKDYLNEVSIDKRNNANKEWKFKSAESAAVFYKKATAHVENLPQDYIKTLLGEKGFLKREQLLAQRANLR